MALRTGYSLGNLVKNHVVMHLSISVLTTPYTGKGGDLEGISNSFPPMPLHWDTSE